VESKQKQVQRDQADNRQHVVHPWARRCARFKTSGINQRRGFNMYKTELVAELRRLAQEMIGLGAKMDYFAGFDSETAFHGGELLGAGIVAKQWADEIGKTIELVSAPDELTQSLVTDSADCRGINEYKQIIAELAIDLACEINGRYGDNIHPAMKKKYDLDMDVVLRAGALLSEA